jgi:phosphoglucomutase
MSKATVGSSRSRRAPAVQSGLKLTVDPLGGAALPYWEPINSIYKLDIRVVNEKLDATSLS